MMKTYISLLAVMTLLFSCAMQAKKPDLKNTRWVCVQKTFVADAGTMTETYTLEFTSDKSCVWKASWKMPAHPAMYMNPDGTVDTIPASSSEWVSQATWRFDGKQVILLMEDGSTKEFRYEDDRLIGPERPDGEMVFERAVEEAAE